MTEPHATLSSAGGVLTVPIDRPDKLNAISPEVTAALASGSCTRSIQPASSLRASMRSSKVWSGSEALGPAKLAIDMSANTDPTTARNIERIANTTLLQGHEHRERVTEFRERSLRRTTT
ncbi:MAG TPA: hypothetical protein VHW74_10960 [Mycobacteriales bacterium]|jgi:enoyl-CoA hydratase/carnithine racemase|nr:hypothetical protein [Mycobacteriales bacterium]